MKILISSIDKKSLFLFVVITFLLQLSFNYNFFNAANDSFFKDHQKDSEALVIGKIINSQNGSLFNSQLLSWYGSVDNTYDVYLNDKISEDKIINYNQSFGFQGYFYSILNKFLSIFSLTSKNKLDIMYFLTSLAMSLTFTIFILLVKKEFGVFTAIILLIGVIYSQWLVVFAKNLYWMTFFLFLPFVYSWYILKKEESNISQNLSKSFYGFIFLMIYLKSLSGFEYLSTIFISLGIPFIYFYFKNNWKFKELFKRLLYIYISAFAAFFISVFTFLLQKKLILGSFEQAFLMLVQIVQYRTYGNSDNYTNPLIKKSLESNIEEVILKYWDGNIFDLQSIFGKFQFITFREIILLFIIIVLIYIILNFKNMLKDKFSKEQKSLLYVTIISSLAPLSWYVLAKAHSYVHTHMNHILWYLPLLLLIFIFIGLTVSRLKFSFKQILSIVSIILVIYFIYLNNEKNERISLLLSKTINVANIENNLNIFINSEQDKLIYFYRDCKNKDLNTHFFLHLIPDDINNLLENRKQYKFDNLDFYWNTHSLETPFLGEYKNSCIEIKDLPKYNIKVINTGQYNAINRLWQTSIDLTSKFEPLKEFQSFNLTDANWENGISLAQNGFFIENNFLNRQSLKIGDKIDFSFSGRRTILNLSYSNQYINIFVDGEKLDPVKDGYPNKIKLVTEANK